MSFYNDNNKDFNWSGRFNNSKYLRSFIIYTSQTESISKNTRKFTVVNGDADIPITGHKISQISRLKFRKDTKDLSNTINDYEQRW